MSWTDPEGVERHRSLDDAPSAYVRCMAFGHRWDPGPVALVPGWGEAPVWQCVARCDCSRVRTDIVNPDDGAILTRQYAQGHGLAAKERPDVRAARVEWFRRQVAAAAGAEVLADQRRRSRRAR